KGNEVHVTESCRVNFSIGKNYKEEVLCDVLDVDTCHLLLGRPWQYNMDVVHHGRENIYKFRWGPRIIKLFPMASKQSSTSQGANTQLFTVSGSKFRHQLKEC
ncbi:hypothetical protein PanWU01x14_088230, partial [Parasponia andersonii]